MPAGFVEPSRSSTAQGGPLSLPRSHDAAQAREATVAVRRALIKATGPRFFVGDAVQGIDGQLAPLRFSGVAEVQAELERQFGEAFRALRPNGRVNIVTDLPLVSLGCPVQALHPTVVRLGHVARQLWEHPHHGTVAAGFRGRSLPLERQLALNSSVTRVGLHE